MLIWNVNFLINFIDFTRPIYIDKKLEIEINDEDFLYIFNKTIHVYLLEISKIKCSSCPTEKQENIFSLNCKCCFCRECIENKLKIMTDGRIILNNYEKSKNINKHLELNKKIILCNCNNYFNEEQAVKILYGNNIKDFKRKANSRLNEIINQTCFKCLKNI